MGNGESKETKRPGPESFAYVKLSMVFHLKLFLFSDISLLSVHIKLWKIFLTSLKIIDMNGIFRL